MGNWLRNLVNGLLLLVELSGGTLRSSLVGGSRTTLSHLLATGTIRLLVLSGETTTHLSLDQEQDLLDELDGIGSGQKSSVKRCGGELALGHEVSTVLSLNLLLLANLGKFVVGDVKLLSIDDLLVEASTGAGSAVGLLVADESS